MLWNLIVKVSVTYFQDLLDGKLVGQTFFVSAAYPWAKMCYTAGFRCVSETRIRTVDSIDKDC